MQCERGHAHGAYPVSANACAQSFACREGGVTLVGLVRRFRSKPKLTEGLTQLFGANQALSWSRGDCKVAF
jgi:hypothetical protein